MPLEPDRVNRRELMLASLGLLLAPTARALGPGSRFDIAEIVLPSGSLSRPEAWTRMLYEVIQSTSVEADPKPVSVAPEDPLLFAHPFSVLIVGAALPVLSEAAVQQLGRYLAYGGFLLIDDATANPGGPVERSVRALCARLYPTRPLSPLPGDHSIYRSFFLLDRPVGRLAVRDVLEGVTTGPTTPLVYCGNDLSGALARGADGRERFPVVPGGEAQRREALKLGVNLVLYSLTSNYKHDIAHELQLKREGRLE